MKKVNVFFEFERTMNWNEISKYAICSIEMNRANKTKFWCAIITNYKTANCLERHFLKSSYTDGEALINMAAVKPYDIIQIRFDERISRKYTGRNEVNALVSSAKDGRLELIIFDTLFKTVKYYHSIKKDER